MNLAAFDYTLPDELIAQEPCERRDASRLLVLDRGTGERRHLRFDEIGGELRAGDLLVFNDTRVIPARLHGSKATGGAVRVLLCERIGGTAEAPEWLALLDASRPPKAGAHLKFPGDLVAEVVGRHPDGWRLVLRHPSGDPHAAVQRVGEVPLPPYIERRPGDPRAAVDRERYQTVYARTPGAIAAPTAGLHFTPELLDALAASGVRRAPVTLHVGPGTFLPIRSDDLAAHRMHAEAFDVPTATAEAIAATRASGGRVIAVGTTTVRAIESAADEAGDVRPGPGRTALFIAPGFRFRVIDALLTNFHLPRSTLILLVAAFAGRERLLEAYAEAVRMRYRFYSYGDAMLVRGE